MASKLYGVNATIIIFVFVLYCIVLYCIVLYYPVLSGPQPGKRSSGENPKSVSIITRNQRPLVLLATASVDLLWQTSPCKRTEDYSFVSAHEQTPLSCVVLQVLDEFWASLKHEEYARLRLRTQFRNLILTLVCRFSTGRIGHEGFVGFLRPVVESPRVRNKPFEDFFSSIWIE